MYQRYPKKDLVIVLTTEADLSKAKNLANTILRKRYAACINFSKVNSSFWWKGEIENTEEIQLMIKSHKNCLDELFKLIKEIHTYENPELIFWDIEASNLYGSWVTQTIETIDYL
tara:strand:+ start:78 stop:422 length:345 start_codon:yes stop_codon:yes gene_type:complete